MRSKEKRNVCLIPTPLHVFTSSSIKKRRGKKRGKICFFFQHFFLLEEHTDLSVSHILPLLERDGNLPHISTFSLFCLNKKKRSFLFPVPPSPSQPLGRSQRYQEKYISEVSKMWPLPLPLPLFSYSRFFPPSSFFFLSFLFHLIDAIIDFSILAPPPPFFFLLQRIDFFFPL